MAGGSIFANFEVLRLGSFKTLKGPRAASTAPRKTCPRQQRHAGAANWNLSPPLALDELSFNREAQEKLVNAPRLAGVEFL